jgi:phage-related protein
MANSRSVIKGITIKIGGDTTELGKALNSANKQGDDLSNELREIDRLLKFDPKNTDLLAQRQAVLTRAIGNTAEKLETLREAERQVQRQFERGEVSEEQVRALQREIIATERRLNDYREEAERSGKETKKFGDTAKQAFEKVGNAAKVGIGAVVAGATAAVGALVASAEATREYRAEMGKLATAYDTAGHSTEAAEAAYKRLYGVIGETDQSVEAAQQIALLADSEKDVAQWADLAAGVVGRFGDALQPETFFEAANETIKLGEATGAYVQLLEGVGYDVEKFNEGLAACTTEAEKQAYMLKITDEILGDAADAYREVNEEVIRANDANAAWTATMAEAGAAVEPILTDVKLLGASLLGELMPGITGVTDAFRGLINGEEGSAEAVGEALSGLITQILDKAVELAPTVVTAVISLVSSLVTTLVSMIPEIVMTVVNLLITSIPLLIDGALQFLMAIVAAIDQLLPPLIEALPVIITTLVEGLVQAIPVLLDGALQLLMAVVQAIPLLLDALLPEVPVIVDMIVAGLLDNIPTLVDGALELFFAILEAIPEISAAVYEEMPTIVMSIVSSLLEAIPQLISAGGQLLEGLVEGMLDFDIWGAVKSVGNSIIKGFEKVFDMHSPSRVMAEKGEMLDEGLAVGIEGNAEAPVNALDKLSDDMLESTDTLNGMNIERRMTHAFNASVTTNPAEGISSKLDQIYKAILSGQVIMLDGKILVGSTAVRYDNELGQRRVLAERGAL